MRKVAKLAFKGVGWANENAAHRKGAGHIPTVEFLSTRVGREPEGIS